MRAVWSWCGDDGQETNSEVRDGKVDKRANERNPPVEPRELHHNQGHPPIRHGIPTRYPSTPHHGHGSETQPCLAWEKAALAIEPSLPLSPPAGEAITRQPAAQSASPLEMRTRRDMDGLSLSMRTENPVDN